jgi:transcriptional regulatory protein RtcR
MDKRTVVLGTYGTMLDAGMTEKRWSKWRPSVDLCRQDDLVVDRFELLHPPRHERGAALIARDIEQASPETEVHLRPLAVEDPWDFEEAYARLHELAQAYTFDVEEEDYLIHITTGTHVMQICFFLLTESRHFPGKLLQTSPPDARDRGAPGSYRIIDLDLSRYDRLAARFHDERQASVSFLKSGIDTRNMRFNRLIEQLERVALRSREPILLMGPTGAGKSQLARQIYALKSKRRCIEGPLVEVNCATIRGDGAMSALFGHVRGAYTGAQKDRRGLLRAADGGMLFLDEIGELGLDEQAMLLRALEEKRFLPVGTDAEVASDFELLAGTNRDLRIDVREGRFREDLFARINLWTFALPSLRDRPEDIEPNLVFELDRVSKRLGARISINKEARDHFLRFATSAEATWPGNFRDLGAAVIRMATLATGGRIDVSQADEEIARLRELWSLRPAKADVDDGLERYFDAARLAELDPFDRVQLAYVVRICAESASLSGAGRRLFAASRTRRATVNDADRVRKYLARFGLAWADLRP